MIIEYPADQSQDLPANDAARLRIVRALLAGQSVTVLDPKGQWRSSTGQAAQSRPELVGSTRNGQPS